MQTRGLPLQRWMALPPVIHICTALPLYRTLTPTPVAYPDPHPLQGRLGERGTDKTFTLTLFNYHFGKNAHLGKPRVGQRLEGEGFTIDHFAGEITYDTAGFLKKNVDELNVDLQTLLNTQVRGRVTVRYSTRRLGVGSRLGTQHAG